MLHSDLFLIYCFKGGYTCMDILIQYIHTESSHLKIFLITMHPSLADITFPWYTWCWTCSKSISSSLHILECNSITKCLCSDACRPGWQLVEDTCFRVMFSPHRDGYVNVYTARQDCLQVGAEMASLHREALERGVYATLGVMVSLLVHSCTFK